jgi:phosphate transport system substrate-binding protein
LKLHLAWLLSFLFVITVLPNCQRSKVGITVAGSTSVEPFAELLAEEYMGLHPASHIYVQGGGSSSGVMAARTGAANIGMASRFLLPNEKDLNAVMIARDAIAIVVLLQASKIFSGKIRNWKEVGGNSHPIVLVTREEGSGTREAFQKFVMEREEISLEALVQDSNGAIRQVVSSDPNTIGYISLGLVNDKVKPLKISGVEPDHASIEKGTYTLVRPFLFIFNAEPEGEAKAFLEFVLSPTAQRLLQKEGLVSVLSKSSQ